jgi:hypothetical protein
MSTYYKYAEQSADSQVNWADVSKSVSDMLAAEVEIRDKKKAAYQEAFDADMKTLSEVPQGKFQDGNKFTNDYAHNMMQQQLIDNRLFKSGNMSPQDYTLRRQKYVNQTNQIFDLQKAYQEASPDRMEGLLSGRYQALTNANMAQIEGFKDFATSKAIINSYTADVSIGKMMPNPKTGVMELTKDVFPINVLKGMILSPVPTWDADKAINTVVDKLGENIDFLYDAASKTKAGTITKLIGYGALAGEFDKIDPKTGKPIFPQLGDSVYNINKGLEDSIDSFFSNPYNITSVLTQNLGGKYNEKSYVYDKDIVDKDKDKILLKIDPVSGLGTLDKDSPNYEAQVKEARAWVKGQMLSKMDAKRELSTTATTPYGPQRQQWQDDNARDDAAKLDAAGAWNQLYTGRTAAEKRTAAGILLGTDYAKKEGLLGIDLESTPGVVNLIYQNSDKNRPIEMLDDNGNPIKLEDFAALGVELHGVNDRKKAMRAGGGGSGYGNLSDWSGVKAERAGKKEAPAPPKPLPIDLFSIKSERSAKLLQSILPAGFIVNDEGGAFGNDVTVQAPNGKTYTYNANESKSAANAEKLLLEKFIKDNSGGGVSGGKVR